MADNSDENDEDTELYDEFGNYIGPELDDSSEEEEDSSEEEEEQEETSSVVSGMDIEGDTDGQNNQMVVADAEANTLSYTAPQNAIVLHEDKEHYRSAEDTYGAEVNTAVLDEDAMDLDTPIVAPVKIKSHHVTNKGGAVDEEDGDEEDDDEGATRNPSKSKKNTVTFNYPDEFLTKHLLSNELTTTRRGVAMVGHFHHGKTTLIDTLLEPTFIEDDQWDPLLSSNEDLASRPDKNYGSTERQHSNTNGATIHYTDVWHSERQRQMSLVSCPITAALSDTRGKSYAVTLVDCPGHVQFHDETVAALTLMDGAVLCVDVVEGIMLHTEMCIQHIVTAGLPCCLCITKLDRVIVELKLPPRDAYYKLLNIIESVNKLFKDYSHGRYPVELNPTKGNVVFSSAIHGYLFTLESFTEVYLEHSYTGSLGTNMTTQRFASQLWGDVSYNDTTKEFYESKMDRSFITFVLEPLYKIYSTCLGESVEEVRTLLKTGLNGCIHLTPYQLQLSARPLLRLVLSQFLQTASCGFVDMIVKHVPPPAVAAKGKIARCYSGPLDAPFVKDMVHCRHGSDKVIVHITKLYGSSDGQTFDAFGRIYAGTLEPNQRVQVLGEGYSPDEDDEDVATAIVESIAIPRGRTKTKVTLATAGNWVLLSGIDATIAKTATIVGTNNNKSSKKDTMGDTTNDDNDDELYPVHIFTPLKFPLAGGESTMKMALEPLNPAELPKMVQGLRGVSKSYPMVKTRVEESGEHVLFGTGELYMDCVLHDLRNVYGGDVEIKVADPSVALRETVSETSSLKCFSETTNRKNKLSFIAEPMDDGLAEQIETGKVKLHQWDARKTGRYFQSQYNWDLLSSRSVWAFGDSPTNGPNMLLDDTLPSEVDKELLLSCKSSIVQGFQWASREGPLCEEPVRGTKIKILDATFADKPIYRGGGQVIPTARRTVHSALLTATPKLMEPIYRVQIQCPGELIASIQPVLKRRRGHIIQDRPIAGTLLYSVRGFIPVLDSFGFETDLRTYTQGQAMVHTVFDHWAVVPGNPLDKSILLHPLEPSPPHVLARELLLKTRRRKGLSEDVSVDKFFHSSMKEYIASLEEEGNRKLVEEIEEGEEPSQEGEGEE